MAWKSATISRASTKAGTPFSIATKWKALAYVADAKNDPSPSKIGKVVEFIGYLGMLAEAGMALAPYATALGAAVGLG